MNPIEHALRRTLLSACCLLVGACLPEVVDLGVYDDGIRKHDAGRAHGGNPPDAAVSDAIAQAPDAGQDIQPPACARTGSCVSVDRLDYPETPECFKVIAHAPDNATARYAVPTDPDHYVKFTLRGPHAGASAIRSISTLVDEARALHRMRLYEHHGALPEGVSEDVLTPAELRLVFSWAPGTSSIYLDPQLGIPVEADAWYTLEAHYNALTPMADSSGFEICFTPAPPAYPVSFSRLGTQAIASRSASGTCTPESTAPIQLLAALPRLGIHGAQVSQVIERAAGGQVISYEQPFSFSLTGLESLSQQVLPGDTLTTRCDYTQRAVFGPGVEDATCDIYVLHWPARSLLSTPTTGQPDSCLH